MILIEKTTVNGFEESIRGCRNPYDSWNKIDSSYDENGNFIIGPNDKKLMTNLSNAGPVESKYLRMIIVYTDVTAPLYWWKEYDTYKVGTVANSCSTMHTLLESEFTLDNFSTDFIESEISKSSFNIIIDTLNILRDKYLDIKASTSFTPEEKKIALKSVWYEIIQLLPSSFNQKRTIMLNYEVLKNIYKSRKNHKLKEWKDFISWIEKLPYSDLIIC